MANPLLSGVVAFLRNGNILEVVANSRPDHEFLDPEEWESWGALMMLHRSVLQSLDVGLHRAHGLAVTEFDLLSTLFNAPDQRLGMSDIADRVLLSPAGTTHLVTRLERDRLVRREVDPTDRRKWFTVLTEEGDRALQAARRTHNEVLQRTLLAATSPTERRTLRRLWHRLSQQQQHPLSSRE
jgi:DNA-binding MarR family transcriptional regulator